MNELKPVRMRDLRGFLRFLITVEFFLMIFLACIFDGGVSVGLFAPAIFGHWATIGYLGWRRRDNLSKDDVLLVKAGLFLYLCVVIAVWGIIAFLLN